MKRQAVVPVVRVGDVLVIDQADYCYGVGPLTLRVTAVGASRDEIQRLEWLGVAGVELRRDGTEGDQRSVLVRTSALPEALRRAARR